MEPVWASIGCPIPPKQRTVNPLCRILRRTVTNPLTRKLETRQRARNIANDLWLETRIEEDVAEEDD